MTGSLFNPSLSIAIHEYGYLTSAADTVVLKYKNEVAPQITFLHFLTSRLAQQQVYLKTGSEFFFPNPFRHNVPSPKSQLAVSNLTYDKEQNNY
jgi:hypothetical protein